MNGCRAAMNTIVSRNLRSVRSVKVLDGIGQNRPVESATAAPLYLNQDLAGVAGFEPATSRLTAERSAELNYTPAESFSQNGISSSDVGASEGNFVGESSPRATLLKVSQKGRRSFHLKCCSSKASTRSLPRESHSGIHNTSHS
jgi:hypothetical protein